MSGETITLLEEISDRLQHTRECEAEIWHAKKCICGVEEIQQGILKYKQACWKELRT